MRSNALAVIAATGALMLGMPAKADVQIGTLVCSVGGGPGMIIGSTRPLACTYNGPAGPEHYAGNINKFGLDIGYLNGGQMLWNVVTPTAAPGPAPGMLSGTYEGVTGSAAVGVGAGAHVLVGGNGQAFQLQPVSVEGQTGFDVAAGIESMNLQFQGEGR
jgi:hypothetical protein